MGDPKSIVHWFPEKDTQKCGYCKSSAGSTQYGMWAQSLTVEDYQNLIDRGWRRSGQYCYKPIMDETCCPLYTIRCNALDFHPSKSQKKVMKKMNKFLKTGELRERQEKVRTEENEGSQDQIMNNYRECPNKEVDVKSISRIEGETKLIEQNVSPTARMSTNDMESCVSKDNDAGSSTEFPNELKPNSVKKGVGADPTKPPCKKAKALRIEKKLKKMENSGQIKMDQESSKQEQKTFEDFINDTSADDKHKLTTKLIEPSNSASEWKKYEKIEFELYGKYQIAIHNDPPSKVELDQFLRFLVDTPLQRYTPCGTIKNSNIRAYGSYHQQYWLDDKLIAVGVVDILPKCVSAVYFFYDPDYRELTLGTYGALKEIQLSRELFPTLNTQFYYMGFYVHHCIKMRYKGNMCPSFLLCPETYEWFPIEKCLPKLDKSKYSRFNEDIDAIDLNECSPENLDEIKIIVGNRFVTYNKYKKLYKCGETYINLGRLVGKKCAFNLFFVES